MSCTFRRARTDQPQATFLKLTSADVMHSFWVPRIAGKTDLLPNRVNEMWFDPHVPGMYVGQCAQFCGAEHAKMLLRVYVDPPEGLRRGLKAQQQTQAELQVRASRLLRLRSGTLRMREGEACRQRGQATMCLSIRRA